MTNLQIEKKVLEIIKYADEYEIKINTMTYIEDDITTTDLNIDIYKDDEYAECIVTRTIEEATTDFWEQKEKHSKKLNKQKAKLVEYFSQLFDNVIDEGNNVV